MSFFKELISDLENKKPIAYLKLIGLIIIATGTLFYSVDVIITVGGKAVSAFRKDSERRRLEMKEFNDKKQIADKIFIEVLSNLNRIDTILNNTQDENLDLNSNMFQFSKYNEFYNVFDVGELDRQIDNFYIQLNDMHLVKSVETLRKIRGTGNNVKEMLTKYFCCEEKIEQKTQESERFATADTATLFSKNVGEMTSGITVQINHKLSYCHANYMLATMKGKLSEDNL